MFGRWTHRAGGNHLPFPIIGAGLLAPFNGEAVTLGGIHHIGHCLGGLAKGQRQYASGERIECAAMPGFGRTQNAPRRAERLRAGHARWFIERQPAVEGDAFAFQFGPVGRESFFSRPDTAALAPASRLT